MALAAVVTLFALAALCVQGCKYTDVLTEHIEDETLGVLDTTQAPKYQENPDAPNDPKQSSSEVQDSERTDLQEESIPVYDENAPENGTAIWREYDPDSPYDKYAAQGTETTEEQETQSEETDEESTSEENSSSDSQEQEETDTETSEEVSGGDTESDLSGDYKISVGGNGTGTVYDATGENQNLPENCDNVAAYGPYATLVEALCGQGGLVACDSQWKADVKELGLFSAAVDGTYIDDIDSISVVWSSDENGSYELDVDALIAADPDAILVDDITFSLTESQTEQVQAASIDIITVPSLCDSTTSDQYVIDAANLVGELMKNSTTVYLNSQTSTSSYISFRKEVLNACLSANGGYSAKSIGGTSWQEIYQANARGDAQDTTNISSSYIATTYFDSWTTNTASSIKANRSMADEELYLHGETVDTSDGVGLSATGATGTFALIDYYFQVSGVVNVAYDSDKPSQDPYVLLAGDFKGSLLSTKVMTYNRLGSALWYCPTAISTDSTFTLVGDADFPGVVANSTETAKHIVSSASKTKGMYNVGQSYSVWVLPSGIDGSWSTGTMESFLASLWAFKTFYSSTENSKLCDDTVDSFYETFYRSASSGVDTVESYDESYTAGYDMTGDDS